MEESPIILSYTDQPNGSTIIYEPRVGGGTFILRPRGPILGYHSVFRWFRKFVPRLWLLMVAVALILHVFGIRPPLQFWVFGCLGVLVIRFLEDWIGGSQHARIDIDADRIILIHSGVFWSRRWHVQRDRVRDVRVTLGKLRFCCARQRTLAATDRCGKGDMLWLANKIRQLLDVPNQSPTLWQKWRDFCVLRPW